MGTGPDLHLLAAPLACCPLQRAAVPPDQHLPQLSRPSLKHTLTQGEPQWSAILVWTLCSLRWSDRAAVLGFYAVC